MCCYRDVKNFDRFTRITQSVVLATLQQLQAIQEDKISGDKDAGGNGDNEDDDKPEAEGEASNDVEKKNDEPAETAETSAETDRKKSAWSQQDREKLLHLLSKIFLLNFPLYIAMKHGGAINPLAPVKVTIDREDSTIPSILKIENSSSFVVFF